MNQEYLDDRQREVLRSVVAHFIGTNEPIGSRTASKITGLGLSPASIRNIMADLEEAGYICQTHASSGRIPTDKGYRYFVDNLMPSETLTPEEKRSIESHYDDRSLSIDDLLAQTAELLSTFTGQAGIASLVDLSGIACRHVDFIHIHGRRILAVVVAESGIVTNKVVTLDEEIPQEQLDKLARLVNDRFKGHSLLKVREQIQAQLEDERRHFDLLLDLALRVSKEAFPSRKEAEKLYVGTKQNIIHTEDSRDLERLKGLLMAMEEKSRLIRILNECLSGGPKIFIGKECDIQELNDCSLVAGSYECNNQVLGTVGVLGPTRMQYARLIAIVDFTAKLMSRLVSRL
ncbi:MAG: heat-inducible transcription repressor HrcA [Candidatus Coatesbacteria bacterium]|nr:MAG: heat-inducible transcription repressor HrcA [Candidatus Coatesbacteria bacterium]HDM59277.1 heat-inducible transcription repressor HrcA [Bacillota bacterium]